MGKNLECYTNNVALVELGEVRSKDTGSEGDLKEFLDVIKGVKSTCSKY